MVFMGCSSLDISISSVSLVLEMFKHSDEKSPYHMGHIICLKTVNPNTDSDWDLLQWVGMNWIIILFMVLIIFISSLFPCRLCHPFWSLFSRHPCLPFFSKVRIKLLVGLYIAFFSLYRHISSKSLALIYENSIDKWNLFVFSASTTHLAGADHSSDDSNYYHTLN